jgi:hypothetical protein
MKGLTAAFLIACMFPYTQFLPIETYTQPYALVFGALLCALNGRRMLETMPRSDALGLLGFGFFGVLAFCVDCLPVPNEQELKYLLIYIAPLILTPAALGAFRDYPGMSRRIVTGSAIAWLTVGLIQTFYDASFAASYVGVWQDAADVVVASGRGVLGLAPEPTHYGFHLIIMAAILTVLGGNRALAWTCVLASVLIARSTSSALALLIGAGLFTLQMPMRFKLPILFSVCLSPFVLYALLERFDPESSRLLYLAGAFLSEPAAILQIDWSVNVRLGGLIATVRDSFEHFLLPHGLSHDYWMEHSLTIVDRFPWLFALSDAGPPSGFGIVVYQLGMVGLVLLVRPVSRFLGAPIGNFDKLIVLAATWVFVGQYFISTPGYSLLYAGILSLVLQRARASATATTPPVPARTLGQTTEI